MLNGIVMFIHNEMCDTIFQYTLQFLFSYITM